MKTIFMTSQVCIESVNHSCCKRQQDFLQINGRLNDNAKIVCHILLSCQAHSCHETYWFYRETLWNIQRKTAVLVSIAMLASNWGTTTYF